MRLSTLNGEQLSELACLKLESEKLNAELRTLKTEAQGSKLDLAESRERLQKAEQALLNLKESSKSSIAAENAVISSLKSRAMRAELVAWVVGGIGVAAVAYIGVERFLR